MSVIKKILLLWKMYLELLLMLGAMLKTIMLYFSLLIKIIIFIIRPKYYPKVFIFFHKKKMIMVVLLNGNFIKLFLKSNSQGGMLFLLFPIKRKISPMSSRSTCLDTVPTYEITDGLFPYMFSLFQLWVRILLTSFGFKIQLPFDLMPCAARLW